MKASSLVKVSITIEEVYEHIKLSNNSGNFKTFIVSSRYISEDVKLQLIKDGYKISYGDISMEKNCLIIEW